MLEHLPRHLAGYRALRHGLVTVSIALLVGCGGDGGDPAEDASNTAVSAMKALEREEGEARFDVGAKALNKVDPVRRPGTEMPLDSAPENGPRPEPAARLFVSGFEAGVALTAPTGYRDGDRYLDGGDVAGAAFQADLWQTPDNRRHWIRSLVGQESGAPVSDFLIASLKTVTSRAGAPGRALSLHSHALSGGSGFQQLAVQYAEMIAEPVLYQRMWIKFDAQTLARAQATGGRHFSQVFWEASSLTDYQVVLKLRYDDRGGLYWQARGDRDQGTRTDWTADLTDVPVVIAAEDSAAGWHKVEIWLDRPNGRVKAAIDGRLLVDRTGSLTGTENQPLNRLKTMMLHSGASPVAEILFDDVEYWASPPVDAFQ